MCWLVEYSLITAKGKSGYISGDILQRLEGPVALSKFNLEQAYTSLRGMKGFPEGGRGRVWGREWIKTDK